jgi:hypothetical protein
MLTARSETEDYVEASNAQRGVAYVCRGCRQPVIFKSGRVRCPHFAHHPGSACAHGAQMSPEHLAAQVLLAKALRDRGVTVQLEAHMASLAGDRRIDVLASPEDRPEVRIAIEVQMSDLTIAAIDARTQSYQAEHVAPLWLRLYDFSKWIDAQRLRGRGTIWIEKHYARAWERWAYDHLGQFLWFMDSKTLRLWRGTFVNAHSYLESSTWYDSSGDEQSAGGYFKEITQWVELELQGPYRASELLLHRARVRGADGRQRLAAWFLAPGETRPPDGPQVRATIQLDPVHAYPYRKLEVKVDGAWRRANTQDAPANWRQIDG